MSTLFWVTASALQRLQRAIRGGNMEFLTWREIVELVDERRKLVGMQQVITAERAMVMLTTITSILREHIHDPAILGAISADFRLLSGNDPEQT